ncbi:MAG: ATP-binding protein [Candidatus Daviesbacteria bacterium]|nr:ATP-binding protein [Candidatus Daviesbacteria bacterium]
MAVIEEEIETRKLLTPYINRLDTFLKMESGYPFADEDEIMDPISTFLCNSPFFGQKYANKLFHDLGHIVCYPINAQIIEGIPPRDFLETCAKGRKRIMQSVLTEFKTIFSLVDLSDIVNENMDIFNMWNKAKWSGSHPINIISTLQTGEHIVSTEENALFRIILNAINNSEKAVTRKFKETKIEGQIKLYCRTETGKIVLDVYDNGIGFNSLLREIDYSPSGYEIPLSVLIEHSKGISGFTKMHLGGTGQGLGIMEHQAKLLGIEMFIVNPNMVDGSCISMKFGQH